MSERAPQHVQNIVIRDFCNKNSLRYLLSASEYKMRNSFLILKGIVSNMRDIDGVVAYSVFQLPSNNNYRNEILNKIVKKGKTIFFAVEQMKVSNKKEIRRINLIWKIKKTLPSCLKEI